MLLACFFWVADIALNGLKYGHIVNKQPMLSPSCSLVLPC